MKRLLIAAIISVFAAGSAMAASCDAVAVGKDGKALSGAAKTALREKVQDRRLRAQGHRQGPASRSPARKASFMKKCEEGA